MMTPEQEYNRAVLANAIEGSARRLQMLLRMHASEIVIEGEIRIMIKHLGDIPRDKECVAQADEVQRRWNEMTPEERQAQELEENALITQLLGPGWNKGPTKH